MKRWWNSEHPIITHRRLEMLDNKTIKLKAWNFDTNRIEETGSTITAYHIAQSLNMVNFAALLDEFLNLGGKGFREGKLVGLQMRSTHRTLQRLVICFAFGLIVGLSEQEYSDPRNETAIETAQKITKMFEDGELPLGFYI
jgi:hypothetical protein